MIWWLYFITALLVYLGMARHYGDEMLDGLEQRNPISSRFRNVVMLHISLIFGSALWFFALILVVIGSKKRNNESISQ